ncbi:hypothetical protein AAEX37_01015 [Oligella sp. MSHR50489EDL]|uniref:phage tail protein I n=1 Tax=Oligella sp. MSHR50489EDL TaxID=3139409 RepID=UPI003D817AE1
MTKLLPRNTSVIERAIEAAINFDISIKADIDTIHRPFEAPKQFLPFIAWQRSISEEEGWNLAESEDAQRQLIDGSFVIHSTKGTVQSIHEIFTRLGFGSIQILENIGRLRRDGTYQYNGEMLHGGDHSSTWATYNIKLLFPVTNDQAANIRRLLDGIAPARSELVHLDYRYVAYRHNGMIDRTGIYNYGSA